MCNFMLRYVLISAFLKYLVWGGEAFGIFGQPSQAPPKKGELMPLS